MPMRLFLLLISALATVLVAGSAKAQAEPCNSQIEDWGGPGLSNGISLHSLEWAPFGSAEWGWETYVPLIQQELGTVCSASSPTFARLLADFQTAHQLPSSGIFDEATFQTFRGLWQERRPFIMARVREEPCPEPPPLYQLGYLVESEEHADRLTRLLRRDVLEARCAAAGNCDGLRRAVCSPHRTGTAVDLYVGQAVGLGVDSTSPASRLHMSRGATYRWLVRNAGRFGFVPYAFEPWHWEWVSPAGGYTGPPPPT